MTGKEFHYHIGNVTSNVSDDDPFGCTNPPNPNEDTALLDSAASVSCMGKYAKCKVAQQQEPQIALNTPSDVPIMTEQTLELLLRKLPPKARRAFRVSKIPHNLVSAAELADAGCGIHLHKHGFEITYEGECLYRGWRDIPTRLWRMHLNPDSGNRLTPLVDEEDIDSSSGMIMAAIQWSINSIYECENKEQLIKYYHSSLCSHPKATLMAAARTGYLQGCKGLTAEAIGKYIGIEDATEAGHMRKIPAGTRSTTKTSNRGRPSKARLEHAEERKAAALDAITIPEQEQNNSETHVVHMTAVLADGWIASDQTGAFPRVSNKGNKYVSVFYVYDANYIKAVPCKSREAGELHKAFSEVYEWCVARGLKPKLHRMDNETSKEVENFIQEQNARVQYSPPDRHCAPAEKSVQTFKSAMKSTMASLPEAFPIDNWCSLLPHIELGANIVRACRRNPRLSAWAAMEGDFHFDSTPIAPPGTEMLMHEKPNRRRSFGVNAKKAWYLGPCLKHYRTFKGYLPSTGGTRMSDTVKMKHHAIAIPTLTPADRILEAARQLDDAMRNQPKRAPMEDLQAIEVLREVLLGERAAQVPPNSVQLERQRQRQMPPEPTTQIPAPKETETTISGTGDEE